MSVVHFLFLFIFIFPSDHVETFSHKSITTDDFKANLYKFIGDNYNDKLKILDSVDWNAWFNGHGMPPVKNVFDATLANACEHLAARWDAARSSSDPAKDFSIDDISKFSSNQIVVFLEKLLYKSALPLQVVDAMESVYKLTASGNCEIRFRWYMLNLASNRETIFPHVVDLITTMGRMKYVRPLYR